MARLTWKKYDYTAQWGPGNSVMYRPLIGVDVSAGVHSEKMSVLAMIDSGTDSTVMNAEIARVIGIERAQCQKVRVGGIGSSDGFLADIRLAVPDFKIVMKIPVIFVENPPFDALLGQRHFFEVLDVRFEKRTNRFFLAKSAR